MSSLTHINPLTDPRWLQLVQCHTSTAFHAPAWLAVLADTYGFAPQAALLVDDDGTPRAGLPYVHVSDIFGARCVTLPFSDFCDPLLQTEAEWQALIQPLLECGAPVVLRPLHNQVPLSDPRFTLTKKAHWHRIDVKPDLEAIWKRNDEATHRAIKKAQRDGVSVSVRQDKAAIRAYFEMHLGIRKHKYGMLAQPWPFFEAIFKHWFEPGQGAVLVASHQDQVVAGTLVLRWKDTLYYKFNASARDQLGARPNDLIMWELIGYAKQLGCDWVDLGLSDWGQEGLLRFKGKYATEEGVISFLKHIPQTFAPNAGEAQLRGLLGTLTTLLIDPGVPDTVTESAGNSLYQFFV